MRLKIALCYNLVDSEHRALTLTRLSLNTDLKDYSVYSFIYERKFSVLTSDNPYPISKHNIQSATELCDTFPFVLLQKCLGCDLQNKTTAATERKQHSHITSPHPDTQQPLSQFQIKNTN